jgi:hypothetical protein
MPATMMPRQLPIRPHQIGLSSTALPVVTSPGWTRKTFALAMHMSCLALFWTLVVSPLLTPIRTGELQREFKPVLQALTALFERTPAQPPRR